ncbi:ribosomal protein S18 acetylase RimI-like enzyme [Caldanaerobacter subterraneus subsp. tengcongensis MB4]|uniref:Acetyltransferases n=2 Tax=Caldanaerobacter subterraneus TaxID=911092 RepID=Q8RD29_CALS4|nr:GNAT family N-acetyltransferase [Caldanaerobacter subterraneus]AAM23519.1 Acetyltransferases [Caldanaerobacter subterraneus subsp. tengcongensis MB4]MCS3917003.1 ribosomal protein S18 acetylase RimI-like enzyme [Caldanaerobacter subterraneus subsp. tengcongensis MB4]
MGIDYLPLARDKGEEIVRLWNKELGKEFPLRKELFYQNSLEDKNVLLEGSWIALEKEKLVGFIISKIWKEDLECVKNKKDTGYIQVILVDSDYRNKGIGSELLRKAEEALKANGVKTVVLGQDPWHYFPGIPSEYIDTVEWFKKKGYVEFGEEYDLYCRLNGEGQVTLPVFPEVEFKILDKWQKNSFLEFLNRCFPGRWEYEAIKYFEKGGEGREFVVAEKKGKIIGFCRINDSKSPFIAQNVYWAPLFEEELGGIGPLGIDPEERGKGYGLAIVQAGMYFLNQRGIRNIVIDWTNLVDFYGKLGCKVWKRYIKYEKQF